MSVREPLRTGGEGPATTRRPGTSRRPETARGSAGAPWGGVLELQRSAGNQAVTGILQVQREEADGSITDSAEMERERPKGGVVDDAHRSRVLDPLAGVPYSKAILDAITKLRGGDAKFVMKWSTQGTFHSAGDVWLDRSKNVQSWIASMAHEITHLHTFLAGKAADIQKMGRQEFIDAKMDDEINAHAGGYVTLLQAGMTSATPMGFAKFQEHLAAKLPKAVEEKKWDEILALAKAWVADKYKNDSAWKTSNTKENYYVYWGNAWDKAHPAK